MSIIALDLGSYTGVARGRAGDLPVLSTWRMPEAGREDMGAFADAFDRHLANALDDKSDGGVRMIVFEAPFLGPKLASNMHTARRLLWMPGTVEMHALRRSIPVFECNMGTVRKGFTGHGKSEKREIVDMAIRRGFSPANHHEADAVACWWFTVLCHHAEHVGKYDPLRARS